MSLFTSYLKVLAATLFVAYISVFIFGFAYGMDIAEGVKEIGKGLIAGLTSGAAIFFIDREFRGQANVSRTKI